MHLFHQFKPVNMAPLLMIFLFLISGHIQSSTHHSLVVLAGAPPLAPALYVLGDSLFDSGNNDLLPTLARANFEPYGVDFAKGDTGRFSNGRTLPDFIAEFLKLPYVPPYLSLRTSAPLTGLNYASGSCGILPETGSLLGKCLTMDNQIGLFQDTVKNHLPNHFTSANEVLQHLSKAIFVISVGSNDYLNNYLEPDNFETSKLYTPQAFARHLLGKLSKQFERLYKLGARKVVMFEIGPIGCIPAIAKKSREASKNGCVEESNKLVSYFNNGLLGMLQNLTSTLHASIFVRAHANWLGYDAIINPSKYGLVDTHNACCKTWGNGTSGCIPWLKPCRYPNKNYFFDAFHLTEAVYSVLANACITHPSVCSPTINQLVQVSI